MIGWLTDNLKLPNKLDTCNLAKIMKIVENLGLDDEYSQYVLNLYREYRKLLEGKRENIEDKIIKEIKIKNLNKQLTLSNDCEIVMSNSHKETYFLLKELNKHKLNNVTVICFDMHSDTYSHENDIWKGNVFSKLLYEKFIDNVLIIGVPYEKMEVTLNDIDKSIKDKVHIIQIKDIEKYLIETKTQNIFISIDLDCLNTRNEKIAALEYCPLSILNNISNSVINEVNRENIKTIIKDSIFVKNDLGYSNLYKVGENGLDLNDLKDGLINIKKCCDKFKLNLGFKSKCYADITEIFGYDYNNITLLTIIELINLLKEVK